MVSTQTLAIVRTIVYSDVFDYPLTKHELHRWLIGAGKTTLTALLVRIPQQIATDGHYFYLKGRMKIVGARTKRQKQSHEKLKIANHIAEYLFRIPTVSCIAITGALAMDNVKKDDDIDVFIIASKNAVWVTRFFVVLALELLGVRRRPNETNVQSKVCANMFIDEGNLGLPKKERDLYCAHEVLQMKPLRWRADTYNKFLKANEWVRIFLPNAYEENLKQRSPSHSLRANNESGKLSLFNYFTITALRLFEPIAKVLQLLYMQRRKSSEVIRHGYLRFHPHDARKWVLRDYKKRLAQMGIEQTT